MKNEKIKGVLVGASGEHYGVHEYVLETKGIEGFYEILKCRCFDIVERKIGEHYYDIYCDDESSLYNAPEKITYITLGSDGGVIEHIYGNIFICKHNYEGDSVSLTDDEIKEILDNERSYVEVRSNENIRLSRVVVGVVE